MNQFNNLPPEIIEFIFEKLNFDDLINLKIVNKRFKQICEQIRIRQLYVSDYVHRFWFFTNDPTFKNKENAIKISKFLNYRPIFKFDKYLKRLSIRLDEDFKIPILNEFKSLEQLEMNTNKLNDNYGLSLDNLKIASIQFGFVSNFKLTLDTNKLFAFKSKLTQLDQFIFNYPHKILFYESHLKDSYRDVYNVSYNRIKFFINLQHLKLININYSTYSDILPKFKNLKTLDLYMTHSMNGDGRYYIRLNDIISIYERENLKQFKSKIYLNGICLSTLINENRIIKWSPGNNECNQLEFQIKNYDLLKDNCCYMNEINYCDLIKLIKIIPSSFTNKFSHIHQVKANDHIDNKDEFIKFLNNLKCLTQLELINCGLTKSFYHELINLVNLNNLEYLIIKEKRNLGLDFDFILNLPQLYLFYTNQTTNNFDLISKLFNENQNINEFTFKLDTENYIEIAKRRFNNFTIYSYCLGDHLVRICNFSIKNLNLDELILKLEYLKFKSYSLI